MKKLNLFFVVTILLSGLFFANVAWAEEKIDSFDTTIKMNQDNSINIVEKIVYDFGDTQKHGIYRDIPYIYTDFFFTRSTMISQISVVDENGQLYDFTVSKNEKDKRIKIGKANIWVTGQKTYIISYRVDNAFIFNKDQDQFYWDIIGGAWEVPIGKSTVTVWLPQTIENNGLRAKCYTGEFGSNKSCDAFTYLFEDNDNRQVNGVVFTQNNLPTGGILTVLMEMPKGTIIAPTREQRVLEFLKNNGIIFLPLLVFVVMFVLWYKRGRDPKGKGNIIVQYDVPDDLSPAEVGTIVDEKVQSKDISAEIIYLAIKGYLKISRIKKPGRFTKSTDYLLEKFKDEKDLPNDYQKEIMANLFSKPTVQKKFNNYAYTLDTKTKVAVLLSDLDKAYEWRAIVEEKIYQSVANKGYFVKNPNKARGIYITVFILALIPIIVLLGLSGAFSPLASLAIALSTIIIVLFGLQMPKKTKPGALTKEYILGLKEYMRVAEKDRLKFHNAPEKNPTHFEALLPYAMVLGVEKEWAKQFEGIYKENSTWCVGFYAGSFNSSDFSHSLNSFGAQAKASFSPPSSSGGGFAGGGGGGGGGGSW